MNYIALHTRASNRLRSDAIRLCAAYVFDDTQNEILEAIFSREESHYDELIL